MTNADLTTLSDAAMSKSISLLTLPAELQLLIFEMVVVENEPLPINCACDSAFGGHTKDWREAQNKWAEGSLHSPWQPALTRTCRAIRTDALPMYYKLNSFRAYYCHPIDFDMVIDWLKITGQHNRSLLRDFCLHDDNDRYDDQIPKKIQQRTIHLWREFSGVRIEKVDMGRGLEHRVDFTGESDPLESLESLFSEAER